MILNIDSSTSVCSVALSRDRELIAVKENDEGLNHSALLGVYIDDILKENRLDVRHLDAVAVSMGPGSYTGLRIGISMAKGLCFGAGKPLIAVPTLQALALSVSSKIGEDTWYCPMLDARRMEVYTALFDVHNRTMMDTRAEIIDKDSFAGVLSERKIYFFGDGSDKIRQVITSPRAHFVPKVKTSATHLIPLSESCFKNHKFVDTAYFEPFYLKDFIATVPKRKVF